MGTVFYMIAICIHIANYPVFPPTWLKIVTYTCSLMVLLIKNLDDVFMSYNVLMQMIDQFVVIVRVELNSIPYSSH